MANFTEEQINKLTMINVQEEKITIEGISGYGLPFKTEGKVTINDKDQPGIYSNAVYVDLVNSHDRGFKQSDLFAPFLTSVTDKIFDRDALYISRINDCHGNVIYENSDFESIKKTVAEEKAKSDEEHRNEGRLIEPGDKIDEVTKSIKDYIGKPIALGNKNEIRSYGVVIGCEIYTDYGTPIIELLDGPGSTCGFVDPESSRLYLIDASGEQDKLKLVASNHADLSLLLNMNKVATRIKEKTKKPGQPGDENN